jgi:hypothetical protein
MFVAAILATGLWSAVVRAQHGQDAALIGTIHDKSGAVVAGVSVIVTSPQLIGSAQISSSDTRGAYRFPYLFPGAYEITVRKEGFKTMERTGITLLPGLTFTIDFSLDIASVSETVVVTGAPPVVDVDASAVPNLIDRKLLENLPLSRTVTDSVNLAPGVMQDVAFGGTFQANPFYLDGTTGNEPEYGTPTVYPNLNWIEELQFVSVGADAQYGEYTGVLQNAIVRSGSNTFTAFGDYWTTRPTWTGDNRGSLPLQLQQTFRPVEVIDRWDSDFQLGGPISKDRLWFFTGGEYYRDAYWPTAFANAPKTPGDPHYDAYEPKFITKVTTALSSHARLEGYIEHDSQHVSGANAGPFVMPEALSIVDRVETLWNARLLWTLSSNAFLEIRHGGHNADTYNGPPDDRRTGPAPHWDTLTNVQSQNTSFMQVLSRPMTTGAHLTLFVGGHKGSHEIRTGLEYEHASLINASGSPGERVFYDMGGQPDSEIVQDDVVYRPTHHRNTLYVQDAWNLTNRLTLNVGVRAGFYGGDVPGHDGLFAAHSVSPRVGAALDVTGNHRTVLRAHYGRYHDEMVTSFYDFLDPASQIPEITEQAVGPGQYQVVSVYNPALNAVIDPNVRFPFVEEYLAGAEHQLPAGVSLRAQYIQRDFKDSIGFIDTGTIWQPVQRIDPGPDGRLGTADDGGPFTVFYFLPSSTPALVLTNPAGAYRRYNAVQLVANKRYSHDVAFQASYNWSRTVASYNNWYWSNAANNDFSSDGVFVNPNRALNADGRTPQDITHELKMLGTYHLSRWGGLNVSGVYRFQSGRPWARSVGFGFQTGIQAIYVEPRGTRELPAVNTLDLRVEKTWKPFAKVGTIGAFADVFNAWNQGVSLHDNERSGPFFGLPVQWLDPRAVRAGVRVMF